MRQAAGFSPVILSEAKNLVLRDFLKGFKDEILRCFVPQNDKRENFPFSND